MDIGFSRFPKVVGSGIIFRWPTHRSDSGACGTRTCSPAFAPNPRCASPNTTDLRATRAEIARILTNGLRDGDVPAPDRTYTCDHRNRDTRIGVDKVGSSLLS